MLSVDLQLLFTATPDTKYIDIWLRIDPDNATNVVKTLDDFGFQSLGLTKDDFLEAETIIRFGYPPDRIDLMTTATGVDFDECNQSKIEEVIDGVKIPFIDLDNLEKN